MTDAWFRITRKSLENQAVKLRRSAHGITLGLGTYIVRGTPGVGQWRLLDTPMKRSAVWRMAIDPADPGTLSAGTGTPDTPGIYRSTDAGNSWRRFGVEIAADCPAVGIPRPTGIAIALTDHRRVE